MYSVYSCPECTSMRGVRDLSLDQSREEIERIKCNHSNAAEYLIGSYETYWDIQLPNDQDTTHTINFNNDISVQCLRDEGSELFLGAYQTNGLVTLLYTVSRKQSIPFCSACASKKCKCFHGYKSAIREASVENGRDAPEFHWERRNTEQEPIGNYSDNLELSEQYRKYGYNITSFEYPIKRDSGLQKKFVNRQKGQFDLPSMFVPEAIESLKCKHGNSFDSSDERLVKTSRNVMIYTSESDIKNDAATFGRPTVPVGVCKCLHHYDGHSVLLWNLGLGKMIDYQFIHFVIHQSVNGTPLQSIFRSRSTFFSSIGVHSTLSYEDFERACSGYASMIRFRKEDFLCPSCGHTPKYIVADGKMSGPTRRKVN